MCHLEYLHCNPILFNSGVVQGQSIGVCVIMDIVVRRCAFACVCGDTSITVRRPVAAACHFFAADINHLVLRRNASAVAGSRPRHRTRAMHRLTIFFRIMVSPPRGSGWARPGGGAFRSCTPPAGCRGRGKWRQAPQSTPPSSRSAWGQASSMVSRMGRPAGVQGGGRSPGRSPGWPAP